MATSITIGSGEASAYDAFRGSAAEFAARLTGDLFQPDDARWDEARRAWNLAADRHPDLVVHAGSADDVAETIRFARSTACASRRRGRGITPGRSRMWAAQSCYAWTGCAR
jgi:hypothetical protein